MNTNSKVYIKEDYTLFNYKSSLDLHLDEIFKNIERSRSKTKIAPKINPRSYSTGEFRKILWLAENGVTSIRDFSRDGVSSKL